MCCDKGKMQGLTDHLVTCRTRILPIVPSPTDADDRRRLVAPPPVSLLAESKTTMSRTGGQPVGRQASTAAPVSFATSAGCETIATWLEGTSTTVALIRLANIRSASGGSASSSVATRYHDGSDFHAGTPITSSNAVGGQRLLNGVNDFRLHRLEVSRKVVHKVVL